MHLKILSVKWWPFCPGGGGGGGGGGDELTKNKKVENTAKDDILQCNLDPVSI